MCLAASHIRAVSGLVGLPSGLKCWHFKPDHGHVGWRFGLQKKKIMTCGGVSTDSWISGTSERKPAVFVNLTWMNLCAAWAHKPPTRPYDFPHGRRSRGVFATQGAFQQDGFCFHQKSSDKFTKDPALAGKGLQTCQLKDHGDNLFR